MTSPSRLIWIGFLVLNAFPALAGQLVWTPGGEQPSLVLSLGDGTVKKTVELPSGSGFLNLTLKKFLLDDAGLQIVWKSACFEVV